MIHARVATATDRHDVEQVAPRDTLFASSGQVSSLNGVPHPSRGLPRASRGAPWLWCSWWRLQLGVHDDWTVSNPLRTPLSAVPVACGCMLVVVGIVGMLWWSRWLSGLVMLSGLAVEIGGMWLHDWSHRRRGETPHALWGIGDRSRPLWFGGPRD